GDGGDHGVAVPQRGEGHGGAAEPLCCARLHHRPRLLQLPRRPPALLPRANHLHARDVTRRVPHGALRGGHHAHHAAALPPPLPRPRRATLLDGGPRALRLRLHRLHRHALPGLCARQRVCDAAVGAAAVAHGGGHGRQQRLLLLPPLQRLLLLQ
ncbi:unnamed protein product, partial [Closterium sp. Naga37s-1]